MWKQRIATMIACIVFACAGRVAVAQEDPGGDDSTTTANFAPLRWEPMITEFYARAPHGTSAVIVPPSREPVIGKDVRGEAAQWGALKPLIAPLARSYDKQEPVFSAWQRWVKKDDGTVYFLTFASDKVPGAELPPDLAKPAPADAGAAPAAPSIHTIFAQDHTIELSIDCDVLMNRTGEAKDKLLKDLFQLLALHVTAVKVSDDPKNFRAAVPDGAKVVSIYALGDRNALTGPPYLGATHNFSQQYGAMMPVNMPLVGIDAGVWEFRILQRVAGRATRNAEAQYKEVQGAIRLAFVNDKALEIRILEYASMRGPTSFVGASGTKSKGTKIVPNPKPVTPPPTR
jgi:hypothetical protein